MYENPGEGSLDYCVCRYGHSRLLFRGPKRKLDVPYCAIVGGTETYGKFIETPYPALLEQQTGLPVINLGCVNAGIDAFMNDSAVAEICAGARVSVVQTLGAQNLSNRFFTVHPRRNDRFVRASKTMKAVYPEVDFTEFHFVRHMLVTLRDTSPERFALVEYELKTAWVARISALARGIPGKTVLLHVSAPPREGEGDLGPEPLFIDEEMIAGAGAEFDRVVQVAPSDAARAAGTDGMIFAPLDAPAAREMAGPAIHREVAAALEPVVSALMR